MSRIHYYKLADIVIRMECDFDYSADMGYMNEFLIDETECYDYLFRFVKIQDLSIHMKDSYRFVGQTGKFHYYQDDEGKDHCFHTHDNYYHAVTEIDEREGTCYYISQGILVEEVNGGNHLENFFCLEKIFLRFGCMVLHSCHIHHDQEAILFSAPSGTGKSTQGELWRRYAGAEVINGDRTAIRKVNGAWRAYGLPFCGTSGIHKNKDAKLKAIIVLRQHPENIVERAGVQNAFRFLYSEVTVNAWNTKYVNRMMDLVLELIEEIPVYLFRCTKDKEAVTLLRDCIEEEVNDK